MQKRVGQCNAMSVQTRFNNLYDTHAHFVLPFLTFTSETHRTQEKSPTKLHVDQN